MSTTGQLVSVLPIIAGSVSSCVYASSYIPMVLKALRSKSLKSYSLSYWLLYNFANIVYWIYVVHLPFGPIWFLQACSTITAGVMLASYFIFELFGRQSLRQQ